MGGAGAHTPLGTATAARLHKWPRQPPPHPLPLSPGQGQALCPAAGDAHASPCAQRAPEPRRPHGHGSLRGRATHGPELTMTLRTRSKPQSARFRHSAVNSICLPWKFSCSKTMICGAEGRARARHCVSQHGSCTRVPPPEHAKVPPDCRSLLWELQPRRVSPCRCPRSGCSRAGMELWGQELHPHRAPCAWHRGAVTGHPHGSPLVPSPAAAPR